MKKQEPFTFWLNKLKPYGESASIPAGFSRTRVYQPGKDRVSVCIDDIPGSPFSRLTGLEDKRLSGYMLALYFILISQFNKELPVIILIPPLKNTTAAHPDTLLPIIKTINEDDMLVNFIDSLCNDCEEVLKYQDFSMTELVKKLGKDNIGNKSPLGDLVFYMEGFHQKPNDLMQDAAFSFNRGKNRWTFSLEYNPALFEKEEISLVLDHFINLLKSSLDHYFPANHTFPIKDLEFISSREKEKIIYGWNQTGKEYTGQLCLHGCFEQQVEQSPHGCALKYLDNHLSYDELNKKINRLAHYLKTRGAAVETPTAVCMKRSTDMIIALYAILKAGGAYVPLDPDDPQSRLNYILQDVKPMVTISDPSESGKLPGTSGIITLQEEQHKIDTMPSGNPLLPVPGNNMSYIIYTSGSTGNPKGAVIEHAAICNRLFWMQDYFAVKTNDVVLQKTPFTFDVSVWELFWPLLNGARLVMAKPGGHKDTDYLIATIIKENITIIHFVPSMLQRFLENNRVKNCSSLKKVICSGEALDRKLVDRFYTCVDARLFNLYGPTEAAVDVTYWRCKKNDNRRIVPIGKPISNCRLYILNQNLEPVPIGVPGELYISGVCLARGYLNKKELTEEGFITNRFPGDEDKQPYQTSKLYKTGDWVRYRWDGAIEFLQRTDSQIKVRGFRVELAEIEYWLNRFDDIKAAVAALKEIIPGEKNIVAYMVLKEKTASPTAESIQIDKWQKIYNQTYSGPKGDNHDNQSDFSGWNSSYTKKPIDREEMVQWVENTVERILDLKPKRVLEVGCGTGLLLYRLAPHVDSYVGFDLSEVVVEKLKKDLANKSHFSHIEVYQAAADDLLTAAGERKFDLVVMNSVAQLFPSIYYLYKVIEQAVEILEPRGNIFLGDIRNYRFLELFHTSVQTFQASEQTEIKTLKEAIQRQIDNEKELLIDPDFFTDLTKYIPAVSNARTLLKKEKNLNELSKFRYDVILSKGTDYRTKECILLDWEKDNLEMQRVEAFLSNTGGQEIHLANIPNSRLADDFALWESVQECPDKEPVSSAKAKRKKKTGMDPFDFYHLGAKNQRSVFVEYDGLEKLSVKFVAPDHGENKHPKAPLPIKPARPFDGLGKYANTPFKAIAEKKLLEDIKLYLSRNIPAYMIPTHWVFLDELPLLPNGKLNRKALPLPVTARPTLSTSYVPAESAFQEKLAGIWCDLLNVDKIGIHDTFFQLGGHSLLALDLLNRLKNQFDIELSLAEFLQNTTISQLSRLMNSQSANSHSRQQAAPASQKSMETGDKRDLKNSVIVKPKDRYKPFPLLDMQQAYLIGRQTDIQLGGTSTHVYVEFEFNRLNLAKFNHALQKLIKRHDMLRCVFISEEYQEILPQVPPYPVEVIDLREKGEGEVALEIQQIRDNMYQRVFVPYTYPLFEVKATLHKNGKVIIHTCYDNLILDGASQGIFIEDMIMFYKNPHIKTDEFAFSFRDYVFSTDEFRKTRLYKRSLAYWKKRIAQFPFAPKLPYIKPLSTVKQPGVKRLSKIVTPSTWTRLKQKAGQYNVTPTTLLICAFAEIIALWSEEKHFTLNIPAFNRLKFHPDVDQLLGEFGSIILLEIDKQPFENFHDLVNKVQRQVWQDIDYNYISGIDVLRELARERDITLMPIVFTSLLSAEKNRHFLNPKVKINYWISRSSQVCLDAVVSELEGALHIDWDFIYEVYPAGLMEEMLDTYFSLLERLAWDRQTWFEKTKELLTQTHLENRITANDTHKPISSGLLHQLFYEHVSRHPGNPALISSGKTLSYEQLYQFSSQLSLQLKEHGCRKNEPIGILLEKGWEQVAAALAILQAGSAYLPIDPFIPVERILTLLSDGTVKRVLTRTRLPEEIGLPNQWQFFYVDGFTSPGQKALPFQKHQDIEDLAYIIYTSGSTGSPKGVAIQHKGAVNTILDINKRFKISGKDRVLALSELNFDLSVYDIFGLLAAGGAIVIPGEQEKKDARQWLQLINDRQITIWNTVPALMELLLEEITMQKTSFPNSLRLVLLSGDWIPIEMVKKIKNMSKHVRVISLGGATEASIWSILYPVNDIKPGWKSIPYGRSMVNQTFHVLNDSLENCPNWVPGELCIGGIGLAREYWGDKKKTREKFIIHPGTGERLYRTGDLGRYFPDGNIEILGRKDFQVKIDGYRIELGEIEAKLQQHADIKTAIVTVKELDKGQKKLVAYYIPGKKNPVDPKILREFLQKSLPSYMIPFTFMPIEEIPLTPNGKVDRKSLPTPTVQPRAVLKANTPPDNSQVPGLVKTLREFYKEELNVDSVSDDESFFYFGGNSLMALRLIHRLRDTFNTDISIANFFVDSSIRAISKIIEEKTYNTVPGKKAPDIFKMTIPGYEEHESYPLSLFQEGVWLTEVSSPSCRFTLSGSISILGPLEIAALKKALSAVIQRHKALRTLIKTDSGRPVQVISGDNSPHLEVVDLRQSMGNPDKDLQEYLFSHAQMIFDLEKGPLYGFMLIQTGADQYQLLITFHHIISDENSFGIFIDDFLHFYPAYLNNREPGLPGLKVQYPDFAIWQNHIFEQGGLDTDLQYWKHKLGGTLSYLDLTGKKDFSWEEYNGRYFTFVLDEEMINKFQALCSHSNATLFMGFCTIYYTLLFLLTGKEDIIIGTPVSGRQWREVENIIGFFVNMLPLRIRVDGNLSFLNLLKRVHPVVTEAFLHQSLPFERIVSQLKLDRKYIHLPHHLTFNYIDSQREGYTVGETTFLPLQYTKKTVLHNIGLFIENIGGNHYCAFSYRIGYLPGKTIEKMAEYFQNILTRALQDPDKAILDYRIGSPDNTPGKDKKQKVESFSFEH